MITNREYEKLFPKQKKKSIVRFFSVGGYFLTLFVCFYFLLNSSAYLKKVSFFPKDTEIKTVSQKPIVEIGDRAEINIVREYIKDMPDNSLQIPSLGISAPIIWDVSEAKFYSELEKGLIHLQHTATPDKSGNVFIAGHSSNYPWNKGLYKTIFATLPNIQTGDEIIVSFQNQQYLYKVTNKKVVKPNDLSVLEQGDKAIISLMTCVPVGTALNRLIVQGELTEGIIAKNQDKAIDLKKLPAIR